MSYGDTRRNRQPPNNSSEQLNDEQIRAAVLSFIDKSRLVRKRDMIATALSSLPIPPSMIRLAFAGSVDRIDTGMVTILVDINTNDSARLVWNDIDEAVGRH